MSVKALITNISRGSFHDGPGVRTVVYFKGCGLKCKWCHNPETLSFENQLIVNRDKCIGCGSCINVCPSHHIIKDNKISFIRQGCNACGKCTDVCNVKALELAAKEMSDDEVFNEILKDVHYYKSSNGGVTFSGGECLLNPDFVYEVAKKCKSENIHTAVETALYVPFENIDKILPVIDLFFVDLKLSDNDKHRYYTGRDNRRILENLQRLVKYGKEIIIRIPVIPDVNDSKPDSDGFINIINSLCSKGNIKYIELLKYNNLASSKYDLLDMEYSKFAEATQEDNEMAELCAYISSGCNIRCIF